MCREVCPSDPAEVEAGDERGDGRAQRPCAHLVVVAEGSGGPGVSAELAASQESVRSGRDLAVLEARVEALRERMFREARWAGLGESLPAVHEILIQVIERLPLPPGMSEATLELIGRLERGVAPDELPDAIDAVSDLVRELRSRVQGEKTELESLLREVTTRLQQMNQGLGAAHREVAAGFASSRVLDARVRAEVQELEAGSRGAVDLEALRGSVRKSLESIQHQLEEKKSDDERREAALRGGLERVKRTVAQLEVEVGLHRQKARQARELRLKDRLTGCFNRLAYDERAQAEYDTRWRRDRAPLSVMVFDLDRFKEINDAFGHRSGDAVLATVAKLAAGQLREADFFARYGGDEFVALLPETDLDGARQVAERVRRVVEEFRFHSRGRRVPLTISCGAAQLCDGDTVASAFERADRGLFATKSAGRTRAPPETAREESRGHDPDIRLPPLRRRVTLQKGRSDRSSGGKAR
jgi:diguanylate cyclase